MPIDSPRSRNPQFVPVAVKQWATRREPRPVLRGRLRETPRARPRWCRNTGFPTSAGEFELRANTRSLVRARPRSLREPVRGRISPAAPDLGAPAARAAPAGRVVNSRAWWVDAGRGAVATGRAARDAMGRTGALDVLPVITMWCTPARNRVRGPRLSRRDRSCRARGSSRCREGAHGWQLC